MTARRTTVLLLAVMLLGLGLRVYDLGEESLWLDEISSVLRARLDTLPMLRAVARAGTNPPLHYLALHGWLCVFPETEASVRLPSVLFQFASFYLLFLIGRRLLNKQSALLACLLFALSSYHILLAQEARPHSLLALLTLASMYLLIRLLERRTIALAAAYVLSTALLLYSHPYAVFVLGAQNLYVVGLLVLARRDAPLRLLHWLLLQGAVLVCFAPWLVVMAQTVTRLQSKPLSVWVPAWVDLPGMFKAMADDNAAEGLALILLAAYASFLLARPSSKKPADIQPGTLPGSDAYPARPALALLLTWLLVPLLTPFIISRISSPIFHARYMICISFPFYLLGAHGLLQIPHRYLRHALLVAILLFFPIGTFRNYQRTNLEPWNQVADVIEAQALPGDLLLVHAPWCLDYGVDYYLDRPDLDRLAFPDHKQAVTPTDLQQLRSRLGDYPNVHLIISHARPNAESIAPLLAETHRLERLDKFHLIDLYHFSQENQTTQRPTPVETGPAPAR